MSLARDGSLGVLSILWRRVIVDEKLYLFETWDGQPGHLYGPMPDERVCTALIRKRAGELKATFLEGLRIAAIEFNVTDLAKAAPEVQDGLEDDPATETAPGP